MEAVARGVDMFDCVLPTRVGRNGSAYTKAGMLQIKGARFKTDFSPIEDDCGCYACQNFTKAYIRHLLNVGEIFGLQLLSLHNLYFYSRIMREMREAIINQEFSDYRQAFIAAYKAPAKS